MDDARRRRIDVISDPGFLTGLAELEIDELRARRRMCADVDRELSYQRRLLHGRLDVIAFERRRRSGDEQRTIAEALPEILGDAPAGAGHPTVAAQETAPPDIPRPGRRDIDFVLGDDFLARLPDTDDAALTSIEERVRRSEAAVSAERRTLHQVENALGDELRRRYREGQASIDDLLPG